MMLKIAQELGADREYTRGVAKDPRGAEGLVVTHQHDTATQIATHSVEYSVSGSSGNASQAASAP